MSMEILWEGKLPAGLFPNNARSKFRLVVRKDKSKVSLLGEVFDKTIVNKGGWVCCGPSIERFMMEEWIKGKFK